MTGSYKRLGFILEKAAQEQPLSNDDLVYLLELEAADHVDAVFKAARELRIKNFGNKIFLYGFLYISTYCRNDCHFCFYRRSNVDSLRYRRDDDEIISAAIQLAASGVHLIDLTLGEDPAYFQSDASGFNRLENLIRILRQETGLPVMISPGVVADEMLCRLARAGAGWYACYQETHNRELFKHLRPGQNYDGRYAIKQRAAEFGLLVEDGLLCGVGETAADIADTILGMKRLGASQIRAMTFVPQTGTPMASRPSPQPLQELLCIAVMRLTCPDRLIPASLDVAGLAGLIPRLNAGANVVTSIVPPGLGLAGVAQSSFDIHDARRTTASVRSELNSLDLQPASVQEYSNWIAGRARKLDLQDPREELAC